MRETRKAILTDARNRLLGNGCAQGMDQFPDVRNLHPAVRATPLTPWHVSVSVTLRVVPKHLHCAGRISALECFPITTHHLYAFPM